MAEFELVDRAPQLTAVVHGNVPFAELPAFFSRAFTAVWQALEAQGTPPLGAPFAYYHGMPGATVDLEAGFPIATRCTPQDEVVPGELPGGRMCTATHVGPYETMAGTYERLQAWIAAQHLVPAMDMWEVYLTDPEQEPDSSTWRTQIYWPIGDAPAPSRG
jgi:effector-binding domain-containing protein